MPLFNLLDLAMTTPENTSRPLSAEEVTQYFDNRNRQLEHESQLFVAQHRVTGLYGTRHTRFLARAKGWLQHKRPSVTDVLGEIQLANAHNPMWSDDLDKAETWTRHTITEYSKYVPDVDFVLITLSVVKAK